MRPFLDRVTVTGGDDSVRPAELVDLQQKFPQRGRGRNARDTGTLKRAGGRTRADARAARRRRERKRFEEELKTEQIFDHRFCHAAAAWRVW